MAFEQKKITVGEVEYTLQKLPVRQGIKLRQQFSDTHLPNEIDVEKACDLCFEHIVVSPKVKLDEFEYSEDAEMLVAECILFQYAGKSEKEKSKEK